MSVIEVQGLYVSVGRTTILNDVSFHAEPGQVTAIVGPNGSGKSTLLKALTGEISFTGTARMAGFDIATARPDQLADLRAVLAQSTQMSFPFQVIEVVRLGLRFRGPDSEAVALNNLRRVGLSGYEARFYQELSGGEQQRAQLARVLCQAWSPVTPDVPQWLFLDEPVASLDIAHQLEVMNIAKEFAKDGGGVLAVMHDLNLSAMFADQVMMMQKGRLVASGAVSQTLKDDVLSGVYGCRIQSCLAPAPPEWFVLPHMSAPVRRF